MNVLLAEANVEYGKLIEIQKLPCSLVMLKSIDRTCCRAENNGLEFENVMIK